MAQQSFLVVVLALSFSFVVRSTAQSDDCPTKTILGQSHSWMDEAMPAKDTSAAGHLPMVSVTQLKVPEKARKTLLKAFHAIHDNPQANVDRYIDRALELYPHYATALSLRAMLERDAHRERAVMDAEKAVEYDPSYGPGYVALGSVYIGVERFDDAIRTLNYAVGLLPTAWQGYYEMSRALLGKRDYRAAFRQIQTTCRLIEKDYPFVHLLKAQILIALSNDAAATVGFEAYLKQESNGEALPETRRDLDRLKVASRHN